MTAVLLLSFTDCATEARFREEFVEQGGIERLSQLPHVANDTFWGKIILELIRDGRSVCMPVVVLKLIAQQSTFGR
jgi:hypothetical protein